MNTSRSKLSPLPQSYGALEETAKEMIEIEMMRCNLSYKDLSRMLGKLAIDESPGQINRKINRKRFSAAFFLACMYAMGVESIPLQLLD